MLTDNILVAAQKSERKESILRSKYLGAELFFGIQGYPQRIRLQKKAEFIASVSLYS